jgi:cupin 2 domain-containing protein
MRRRNIYSEIPEQLPEEVFEDIVRTKTVSIERIVSKGHSSSDDFWYDQKAGEWVIVLKGRARLRFEMPESTIEMGPGDYLDIPPHCRHRVEWTDPEEETVWLAVYYSL